MVQPQTLCAAFPVTHDHGLAFVGMQEGQQIEQAGIIGGRHAAIIAHLQAGERGGAVRDGAA